jgi:hypothetical protein
VARLHHVVLALVLGAFAPAGCASNEPYGRELTHDDVPRCYEQARDLEHRGLEAVEAGSKRGDAEGRREYYERAIGYFKGARELYERELLQSAEAPPERRRNCELEIERLDDLIRTTHKNRPL